MYGYLWFSTECILFANRFHMNYCAGLRGRDILNICVFKETFKSLRFINSILPWILVTHLSRPGDCPGKSNKNY